MAETRVLMVTLTEKERQDIAATSATLDTDTSPDVLAADLPYFSTLPAGTWYPEYAAYS